jgi:predicted RecA/RadA family phage recombinase
VTAYPQSAAQALHRYPFGEVHQVAAQADNGGDVLQLADGRIGIVQGIGGGNDAVAIGDPENVRTTGVYDMACASATTLANGAKAYWDPVACQIVNAAGGANGAYYAGVAVQAKTAGQLWARVDINVVPTLTATLDTAATIAAAGANQGAATPITTKLVFVSGANAAKGVALPAVALGLTVTVVNEAAAVLLVYPHGTEQIDGGGASTAANQVASKTQVYRCDGTNWYSQVGA